MKSKVSGLDKVFNDEVKKHDDQIKKIDFERRKKEFANNPIFNGMLKRDDLWLFIKNYILYDEDARRGYLQKINFIEYLKVIAKEGFEKKEIVSVFDMVMSRALNRDSDIPTLENNRIPRRFYERVYKTSYPHVMSAIESGTIVVIDDLELYSEYALIRTAPYNMEPPRFDIFPNRLIRYDHNFFEQIAVLKNYFLPLGLDEKVDPRRQRSIDQIQLVLDVMVSKNKPLPALTNPHTDAERLMDFAASHGLEHPKSVDTVKTVLLDLYPFDLSD